MTESPRTFKYVDKDRILPWIDTKIESFNNEIDDKRNSSISMCLRCKKLMLEELKNGLETGLFDWQPAE